MKIEKMMLAVAFAMALSGVSVMADHHEAAPAPAAEPAPMLVPPPMPAPAAPAMEETPKAECSLTMCEGCTKMVTEADADANGTINAAEFDTLVAKCEEMKKKDDAEGETAKEMPSAADMFAKGDADANGELSNGEMVMMCVSCEQGCPDCKELNKDCAAACEKKAGCDKAAKVAGCSDGCGAVKKADACCGGAQEGCTGDAAPAAEETTPSVAPAPETK